MTRHVRDIYPLTSMQQGMLVESLAIPGPTYLQHYHLALTGVPDAEVLRAALADLVARHDALRTAFVWDVGTQPLQVVRAKAELPMTLTDLRDRPDRVEATAAAALAEERSAPLDLRRAPLARVRALRVTDGEWRLITTHHHLVLDGWSVPILHAELAALLDARLTGRPAVLRPAAPFREFVRWQRDTADAEAERRYFADLLGDVDRATPIGADLPRHPADRADGPDHDRRVTVLHRVAPADHPDLLGRAAGVLPSTLVHAAWALLLARWADVDRVVFGTTVAGRPPELSGAAERIGMFLNTAPLRVDLPDTTIGAWLADVHDRLSLARRHEHAPLLTAQQQSALPAGAALLSSVLAFQNFWRVGQDAVSSGAVTLAVRQRAERVDLPVVVAVALPPEGVWVRLDHDGTRLDRAAAERAADRLARLVALLGALPAGTPLSEVPIDDLPGSDAPQPAADLATYAAGAVLQGPDGTADAAALAAAAETTAEALAGAGLDPGDRVGIAAPIGLATGSAVLAVLRSGAVVVPVSPYLAPAEFAALPARLGVAALLVPEPAGVLLDPGVPVLPIALPAGAPSATPPITGPMPARFAAGVRLLADQIRICPGDLVSVLLAADDPALPSALVVALGAGATVTLAEPADEGAISGATVVLARPAVLGRHAGLLRPDARVVLLGDPPAPGLVAALVSGGRRVFRATAGARTGAIYACTPLAGPAEATRIGGLRHALVLGRSGRPVPADVPGELALSDVDGLEPLGIRVRTRSDGGLDQLGHGAHDDLAHLEYLLCRDADVADAVLVPADSGRQAWVVPADGRVLDSAALDRRLRAFVPPSELPSGYRQVAELPLDPAGSVDRAALEPPAAAVTTAGRPRTPVADRLAALPAATRDDFVAHLRGVTGRTPGLRAAARDDTPSSVQQDQWLALAPAAARAEAVVPLGADLDPAALADALALHGIPAGALRVERQTGTGWVATADPAELDVPSVLALAAGAPVGKVSAADYAAWQTGPDQAASRDEQRARWRDVLGGVRALRLPLDRGGSAAGGERTHHAAAETTDTAVWLAAVAVAVCVLSGSEDVVIGLLHRPSLPAELDGVPGPFTRMLPVRLTVDLDAGYGALVAAARDALADAVRDGDVPWSDLTALLPEPLPVSLAVHGTPAALAAHAGPPLAIDVAPTGPRTSGTTVTVLAAPGRAHPATADRLGSLVTEAVRYGLAEPDRPLRAAGLLTEEQRAELVRRAAGNPPDDPAGKAPGDPVGDPVGDPPGDPAAATLPDWIRQRAVERPAATAVLAGDGELSYAELVDHADRLAARLGGLGVGVDDRVGVCLPRGLPMVWAPLGVMTAGAGYVPLDPLYPDERLHLVCADAGVTVVVTTAALAGRFPSRHTVLVDDGSPAGSAEAAVALAARPDSAAYVIYTSGSTGTPKGVLVEHRAITDFCRHIADAYRIGRDTRLLGFAALTFDVSAFDLWAALTAGAVLVLAGDEERASVEALQRLLRERRVTMAELPPSLMPLLDPTALPDLHLVSVGGEAPPGALVDGWATADREFWNGYGPTETTVAVTLMRCQPPADGRVPPIGLPMPGHHASVLDADLALVPDGAPGELCISGPGLARGYLGRPGLTAERFVPDPLASHPGARMYRTGDLVRWTTDGVLEFLGRIDRQVKIRGFRVEPGDVESALARDPAIRQAVVEPWDDPAGVRHLVAYVVAADPARPPTLASVRDSAAATLPGYLLPTRVAVLDRLPMARNGKVDRAALPEPLADEPADAASADQDWTETERVLATEVIAPLLGRSAVARDEDFFQAGGNSLQATQVTARVRDRFGVEVSLLDFFTTPTVGHLASMVDRSVRTDPALAVTAPSTLMTGGARLPLSYPQRALYDACRLDGDTVGYHAPFPLRFSGRLDLDALRRAFDWLVDRHAPLRVSFVEDGDGPVQVVHERVEVPFAVVDVPGPDPAARAAAVPSLLTAENRRPFDLATGPLLRVTVYRIDTEDHVVVWNTHHIVTDGWSTGVQVHDIDVAYEAFAGGRVPDAEPLGTDYGEFVAWQQDYVTGPDYADDLSWWRAHLADAPPALGGSATPVTPADFVHGWRNLRLSGQAARDVRALVKQGNATLYMVLLAAYAVLLSVEYEQDDLLVVTPNALRVRSAWEELIGWFVNRVVVRLRVRADLTFAELVEQARAASLEAFAHGKIPLELLRAELALPAQAMAAHLSVQNAPAVTLPGFAGLELSLVGDASGRDFTPIMEVYSPVGARYQISVMLRERHDGSIAGGFEFDAGRLPEDRADAVLAALLAVLGTGAAQPDIGVGILRDMVTATLTGPEAAPSER